MSPRGYYASPSQALKCFRLPGPGGGTHLMLVGQLDLVTADHAREAIRHAQDESRVLVCDLGDVWFIDVAGLHVLLDATARARQTGARAIMAHCPPIAHRMLRLLGLEGALEFQDGQTPADPYPAPPGATAGEA